MKSAMMAGVVGVFLFVASAGLSWWLIYTPQGSPDDSLAATEEQEFPIEIPDKEKTGDMPVSLRPDAGITMESVTELAESIMNKERRVFESEQALKKEEQRIEMLFEDLRREQEELDAFAERVDAMIIEAKEAVKLLQLEKQAITAQTEELSALEKKTGVEGDQVADVALSVRAKQLKNILEEVEPSRAGRLMQEWIDGGNRDLARQVLLKLDERKRGKILSSFDNYETIAEILVAPAGNTPQDRALVR